MGSSQGRGLAPRVKWERGGRRGWNWRGASLTPLPRRQNDVGGDKLLQKKWTTFLKAQLLCSQPGQLPFNVIRHAVLLPAAAPAEPRVYATFSSQW